MNEILLIEDSQVDADHIKNVLSALGVKNPVRHLRDGAEGLSFLRGLMESPVPEPPSVLILDVKLPWMTGFDILSWMRGHSLFHRTLKVVLTSLDDTSLIKDAYHLGANSFLSKPLSAAELREMIKAWPQYWRLNGSGHYTHARA